MNRKLAFLLVMIGFVMVVLSACGQASPSAPATEVPGLTEPPVATQVPTQAPPALTGDVARGGRLYDRWIVELGVDPPEGDHPLWATQSTNTRTGQTTWRCKECHGWDYKGVDGEYGAGSHLTGFAGVLGVSGKDPSEILAILKGSTNPDHDFSAYMDDQALTDLALFLSETLIDYSAYINPDGSFINSDVATGESFFGEVCMDCHGPKGVALNFGDVSSPEYQGTLAEENRFEFMHKMRYGQPGFADMPSLVDDGVEESIYANVLAHVSSFPTSSPVSEGGELYDNWMAAMGVETPASDQPLFATQTTNTRTGTATWRCKECHGWDYNGVDGEYGSGNHLTGFKGIRASSVLSSEDLTAWLNGGKNPDHNFVGEGMLGEAQVASLVAFLQSNKIDTSAFISADGTVTGGYLERGADFFSSNCAACHGEDGTKLNFGDATEPEYVGTVAVSNPREFVHKVSYGNPGFTMVSGINMDWSLQDIIDLLTFARTLPTK
jgi:mono/diheme cytochrome c family protein